MEIKVEWYQPMPLTDGFAENLIYTCNIQDIPNTPGVYVFARKHGETVKPLYVGRSINLRRRIKQQLNNTTLMKGIQKAQIGGRILLIGELELSGNSDPEKRLKVLEPTLIEHFLTQGHQILNKQGVRTPVHNIEFYSNLTAMKLMPRKMLAKKRK